MFLAATLVGWIGGDFVYRKVFWQVDLSYFFTILLFFAGLRNNAIFTARCYASVVQAVALGLSVRPSQVGVLLKRLNAQTSPHASPWTLVFWSQRSPEIRPGSSPTGAPNVGGWVKIGDFRQITGYISKMVQDWRMVSIKVEVVCTLSNGDIADDFEWPLSAPNYPNLYILHRFSYLRNESS